MKKFNLGIMALALMATAFIGFAGVANAGMGHNSACVSNQNLTPEQQAKMEKMHTEFLAATETTRQQLIMKNAELKAQMTSSNPDTAKIESISKDLGALEGKMRAECVKFKKLLGAEGLPCVGMGAGMGKGMGGCMGDCMGSGMGSGMGKGMMKDCGSKMAGMHGGNGGHGGHKGNGNHNSSNNN